MNPREHAGISALVVIASGIYMGIGPAEMAVWTVIGVLAGVLVDADHFPRAMVFNGRVRESLYWMRRPVACALNPGEVIADTDPEERLQPHRIVSHTIIFLVLMGLYTYYFAVLLPVVIAVGSHIITDIAWDIYTADGFPYI